MGTTTSFGRHGHVGQRCRVSLIDRAADGRAGGHPASYCHVLYNYVRAGFELSASSYHGGTQKIMDPFYRSLSFMCLFLPYFTLVSL